MECERVTLNLNILHIYIPYVTCDMYSCIVQFLSSKISLFTPFWYKTIKLSTVKHTKNYVNC